MDPEREIGHALRSYCRGIDRLDATALLAAFHPGAQLVDYGPDPMAIEAFVERALSSLRKRFSATQHRISNTTVDFTDDTRALVETYVLAFHVEPPGSDRGPGEPGRLHTFNGRYIDRFEARDGRWLIATRTLRVDWTRVEEIDETMTGAWVAGGRAGEPDPLYDQPD